MNIDNIANYIQSYLATPDRWNRIVNSYLSVGHGYERYGREDLGDWGLSLNSIASIVNLGIHEKSARVIALSEAGWGNHQDVIAIRNVG